MKKIVLLIALIIFVANIPPGSVALTGDPEKYISELQRGRTILMIVGDENRTAIPGQEPEISSSVIVWRKCWETRLFLVLTVHHLRTCMPRQNQLI